MNGRFTLELEVGNDAMRDSYEVAEALRVVAARFEGGTDEGTIRDANGNKVGRFEFEVGR